MLPDGSFVAAGNETVTPALTLRALIMKVTAAGSLQWSRTYSETDRSFPGALSGADFTFEEIARTSDGGYIASGVADAHFSSGYAHVLVVMKLHASGTVQWSKVYYGTTWLSGFAGGSRYPIFQAADGSFVLSGTVQARTYPFENLFFLLKLDAHGNIVWQKGYGGVNGTRDHTSEQGGAAATSDGGYVMAGKFEEGCVGVSAAVEDSTGEMAAIITVTGPSFRMPTRRLPALLTSVRDAARAAETSLGYAS